VTGANSGIDDLVSGTNKEMNGPSGIRFADYPTQRNVTYRVFLRDDFDEAPPTAQNQTVDSNGQVWLVAIGQVSQANGTPLQSVVTALVTNGSAGGGLVNGTSQRVTNVATLDSGAPLGAGSVDLN
jgi:hypothetical protein